jgi:hypothetical protein
LYRLLASTFFDGIELDSEMILYRVVNDDGDTPQFLFIIEKIKEIILNVKEL